MKLKRRFNVTGSCIPERHYMVRLDDRLKKITEDFINYGSYFVINRGRQYGKTTTLRALEDYLKDDYIVLSLDFQQIGTADFASEQTFVDAFADILLEAFSLSGTKNGSLSELLKIFLEKKDNSLKSLFACLSEICRQSPMPIVLMIDEVDSASNNQVFIDFLAQLRGYYLKCDKTPIFHSVILAGVFDIKNLKLKLRPDSEHQYNSPWSIAAKFSLNMNFSPPQIAQMLKDYEADHGTGMDIQRISEEIYRYTSGYPVLVSLICKYMDEELPEKCGFENSGTVWSIEGVAETV